MKHGELVADLRLWAFELPVKWERLVLGQKIMIPRGQFKGRTVKVVGKAHIGGQFYTYCNWA